ncbi:MAG: hypothetical protein ACYCT1_08400 [Steroidobacteraceae bacterium]
MLPYEQGAIALLESVYPNLAAIAARGAGDPAVLRAVARSLDRVPPLGVEAVQPVAEAAWLVAVVASNQAALGVLAGGTTFAVTAPNGSPVTISAAGSRNYRGATVLFRTGMATGRRTVITDVRQSGIATWVTVADLLGLGPGDQLVVEAVGTPAARGVLTDGSSTIKAAATSQAVFAVNPTRSYLLLQNPKAATDSLWFNFGTAAVTEQPSIELPPGSTFTMDAGGFVETDSVNIIGAAAGDAFTAKQAS